MRYLIIVCLALALRPGMARAWGFLAHKRINHLAVYMLPEPMLSFYKRHQAYLAEAAPNPDKRRNMDPAEAPRHYIDLDVRAFADSFLVRNRPPWQPAVAHYTEDTLNKYGTVPWQVQLTCYRLTKAFEAHDWPAVIYQSAELGHYVGDANVPLHTTENYDGQLSGQRGIHALWESRLPEQFYANFTFLPGKAQLVPDINARVWADVLTTHRALDSVLRFEQAVQQRIPVEQKTVTNERGTRIQRQYSEAFSAAYHQMLAGQVERRLHASIRLLGDLWYTCWMNAGQPTLPDEMGPEPPAPAEPSPRPAGKAAMKREEE